MVMHMFAWVDDRIKRLKWYDIGFVKWSVFFFTLFLIAVWDAFRNLVLSFEWYWYLALYILFVLPVLYRMFSK
jgi:hypothetical protein